MKSLPEIEDEQLEEIVKYAKEHGWDNKLELSPFSDLERIMFSYDHDFAQCLWGDRTLVFIFLDEEISRKPAKFLGGRISYSYDEGGAVDFRIPAYKYHLAMLAVTPGDRWINYIYNTVRTK